jgi:hypothetical protein
MESMIESAMQEEVLVMAQGLRDFNGTRLAKLVCCADILENYSDYNLDMVAAMDDLTVLSVLCEEIGVTNTVQLATLHTGQGEKEDCINGGDKVHHYELGASLHRWEESMGQLADDDVRIFASNVIGPPPTNKEQGEMVDDPGVQTFITPSADLALLLMTHGEDCNELSFSRPITVYYRRDPTLGKAPKGMEGRFRGKRRPYPKKRHSSGWKLSRMAALGKIPCRYPVYKYCDLVEEDPKYSSRFMDWMITMLRHKGAAFPLLKFGTPNWVGGTSNYSEILKEAVQVGQTLLHE